MPQGAVLSNFKFKRVVGAISWFAKRRQQHRPEIAAMLAKDIRAQKPDHVAFTGDLLNIAALKEFDRGLRWLEAFGKPDWLSYSPGNHDAYVAVPWARGLAKFEPYMSSDLNQPDLFPFIRLRRYVALIGLNGACPQSLWQAGGEIGSAQLARLKQKLDALKLRGFYRVVMIHHPPAPGLAHPLRSLKDAGELADVLKSSGAELVIHGHNHTTSLNTLEGTSGQIPIIGVPSASLKSGIGHHSAAWNNYEIARIKGQWQTKVKVRELNPSSTGFTTTREFVL